MYLLSRAVFCIGDGLSRVMAAAQLLY